MRRLWLQVVLPACVLSSVSVGWAQKPTDPLTPPENIEAVYKVALASAAEYEFHLGKDKEPLKLVREPKLKWSNPERSDVQGTLFVWTREDRPLVVGSFHKWRSHQSALTHWEHEFHSLAEEPLRATFHEDAVWTSEETGVNFVAVPEAAAPASNPVQRRLQLRKLAREFSVTARYQNATSDTELRLLPRPIHSYAAPKQGIVEGGLFAFVKGTDPDLFLLIEARGKNAATARWHFAAARMTNGAALQLRHQKKQVWEAQPRPWKDVTKSHKLPHTAFSFNQLPDFLKEETGKTKP